MTKIRAARLCERASLHLALGGEFSRQRDASEVATGTLALWVVLFEVVFPRSAGLGVSDPLDVLAYWNGCAAREFRVGFAPPLPHHNNRLKIHA